MPVNVGYIGAAGSYKDKSKADQLGYRINYISNPTFEISASDWTPFAGTTLERTTTTSYTGKACLKVTNTSGGGAQNQTRIPFISTNDVWTISAYVKIDGNSGDATYYLRHLQYATDTSSAAIASGNIGVVSLSSSDGWVRLSGSFTKSPSANFFVMRVVTTSASNTDVFYIDGAMAEYSSTVGEYFDGSFGGFWTGSEGASRSAISPKLKRSFILGGSNAEPGAIALDSLGNIYSANNNVAGLGESSNLTKYNPNGDVIWEKKISFSTNEVYIYDLELDSQENIVAVGRFLTTTYIGFVIKFDKDGNVLWQRQHTGEYEELYSVAIGPEDSIYVGGSTYFSPPNYTSDIYVVKYNSAGVMQWKKQIQGTSFDEEWVSDGVVDVDGNYYGTCYQLSDISGDEQLYTFKLSSAGALTWQKYVGSTQYEQGDSIVLAPNGDIYILGSGYNASNIVRYDVNGTLIWQKEISNCYLSEMAVDKNSNLYLAGDYLVKMDPDGNMEWQRSLGDDFVSGIKVQRDYIFISSPKGIYALPQDGSKYGTYTPYFGGTYTYTESTNLVVSTTSYPSTTPSLTISNSNIVDGAASSVVVSESVWAKKYTIE